MKRKSKFLNRLFVCVLAIAMSAGALFAGIVLNKTKYTNAAIEIGKDYSQKDEGDIVLSVEKVGIASTGDDYFDSTDYDKMQEFYASPDYDFKNALYKNDGTEFNSLAVDRIRANVSEYPKYYYTDIRNTKTNTSKTVYQSGDYIMLENSLKTKTVNGKSITYYYTPNLTAYNSAAEGKQEVDLSEGVLFSFGSYIYGTKTMADNSVSEDLKRNSENLLTDYNYAKDIQQINVSATRNGEQIILPVVRQYGANNYQDFSYIIPQRKGFDGHYEFVVEYRHNEEFKRQTFSFELVFKSTYTEAEMFENGSGQAYATLPTLSLPNAVGRTFILGSSEQYPTLTYDFSKYTLDYTHTANGVTTSYSYRRVREETAGENYTLVCTITDSNGTSTKRIGLPDGETKAVIMFTEAGSYQFNYNYIYNGEQNSMGFELQGDNLTIVGYELKYAKVGYSEAQMRYVQINKHVYDKVVLVVPNGFERYNQPTDTQKLGVAYSINETTLTGENNRTGYVDKIQDALINNKFNNVDFDALFAGLTKTNAAEMVVSEKLNLDMYQQTNQGGVWLTSNLSYRENEHDDAGKVTTWNSFYIYSAQPILSATTLAEGKTWADYREEITNLTTFNKVGYYLVLITVEDGTGSAFKQVFAFRYTNQTSVVNVMGLNSNTGEYDLAIGSGKFTNQNVKISWEEPKVFERAVSVGYYSVKNTYLTRDESKSNHTSILTATELRQQSLLKSLENDAILGGNLAEGEGASFLIEATNEGQAKAYRSFTIDRTNITGVGVYAIRAVKDNNGNTTYAVQTDELGGFKKIESIADAFATIYWADKASGATINATYYYTPILKDSGLGVDLVQNSASQTMFTNKYKLGVQTGPFKIEKPTKLEYTVSAANVLKNNGIYLFDLVDEAGNKTSFMFIIDGSEQYFKVKTSDGDYYKDTDGNEYFTNTNLVFADKVNVEFATHKAIELFSQGKTNKTKTESLIEMFVSNTTTDSLKNAGYFVGVGSNSAMLGELFNTYRNKNYLVVANTRVASYNQNDQQKYIGDVVKTQAEQNPYYTVDANNKDIEESSSTAFIRNIYIVGANQFDKTDMLAANSFIRVEINDDHSLGKAYFTMDANNLKNENKLSADRLELYTGKNIDGAQATSDNLVAFYWTQGTGNYLVKSITYKYYSLSVDRFNQTIGGFYDDTQSTGVLYSNNVENQENVDGQRVDGSSTRFYNTVNVQDGKTQEGLYIVTRTYADNSTQDYWFIVDRQSIIADADGLNIGKSIKLLLREEVGFNSFGRLLEEKTLTYYGNSTTMQEQVQYTLSLATNKLPLQIKVPVGKYFKQTENKASSYYAGRLNFTIYFLDNENQIGAPYYVVDNRGNTIITPAKLFSTLEYANSGLINPQTYYSVDNDNGYLYVNLEAYLTGSLYEKYIKTNNQGSWLWLPGDYVVVIEDNVKSSTKAVGTNKLSTTKTAIGFTITANEPAVDIMAVTSKEDGAQTIGSVNQTSKIMVTNAEFVKLVLPGYDVNAEQAQIDPDFLIIDKYVNGSQNSTRYINYQYKDMGGEMSMPTKQADGSRIVWLDTALVRDASGNVDYSASAKMLRYVVRVRFRISSNLAYDEKYKDCYIVYTNGNAQYYYETSYTITIDREPPTKNTDRLEHEDKLAGYYNAENGTDKMLNLDVCDTASGLYFVNQYTKYYQTKDAADLYAFVANASTPFEPQDIEKLYFRKITNDDLTLAALSMPVTNFATYTEAVYVSTITNFAGIIPQSSPSGYYEIVEIDAAGNINQYVVLYATSQERLSFTFNANYIDNLDQSIKTEDVTLDDNNNAITLFEISASTNDQVQNRLYDNFFHIELINTITGYTLTINTNAKTKFTNSGLAAQICEAIKSFGRGNYALKVVSRQGEQNFTINYYDKENRVEINVANLVKVDSLGNYTINLHGANIKENNIMYYAKEIIVISSTDTKTYSCIVDGGEFKYYLKNADGSLATTETTIIADLNGTYQIVMTDAFGSQSTYRFDTVTGDSFYGITFEGATADNNKYYEHANTYYGFTAATINFNADIYKKVVFSHSIDGNKVDYVAELRDGAWVVTQNGTIVDYSSIKYQYSTDINVELINFSNGAIKLLPFTATNAGANVKYTIELWYNDVAEKTFNVVIDSYTKQVALKNTDNVEHEINFAYNEDYEKVMFNSTTSGVMNLMWTPVENDYFVYSYRLHERMQDNTISSYNLDGLSNYVINTLSTSKGVYWFEIEISTVDGKRLGNKVYAFSVVAVLTDLYYVQTEDMVAIKANSSFKFSELNLDSATINKLKKVGESDLTLPITNIPLYISNQKLVVIVATDQGANALKTDAIRQENSGLKIGDFTIYRVYTNTYSRYFATLEMEKPEDDIVASNVEFIKDGESLPVENFEQSVYLTKNQNLILSFAQDNVIEGAITAKNLAKVSVYHNGVLLSTDQATYNSSTHRWQYVIKGSGKYTFEIGDIAGNTHLFSFDEDTHTQITVNVMKNIYFTMNGLAPIDNAVFNDAVELAIYEPSAYDSVNTKPINLSQVTRNGVTYEPKQKGYAYTFEDYGNYKVTFTAMFNGQQISSSISFTILNKNEARASYDLTSIAQYTITKVVNQDGMDITERFLQLINPQSAYGRLLTYQTLMDNADELGISAGKQSFEITYEVADGIYPTRAVEFVLTMNDEQPTIDCSVELGKETNKGFEITFNPGIIYEQVGDSFLYINDTLICAINENSVLEQLQHSISQKVDGAGDYYVKLVGSSGSVITSFKVVVKEPLNAWAIIIIVVVSAIVLGVTITILVLRNKMRIR